MGPLLLRRTPRRWVVLVVARNAARYLFRGAARSWSRNLAATAPALGSMTLLLTVAGLGGLGGLVLHALEEREAGDAAVLHVYLRDDADPTQVAALRERLAADPRVASVTYTSKAEALARAQQRPGLAQLAGSSEANPFPASLDLKLRDVRQVGRLADSVKGDPAVDPVLATSFDPGTYQRLQSAMAWLGGAGGTFLAVLGLVAVMVTGNSIRSAIHARREEVAIMQLVGAPRWMVRGPFVVEGALTGAVAGLLASAVVALVTALAAGVGAAHRLTALAPGLTPASGLAAGALVLLAGVMLGAASSLLGIRRHLES